MERFLTRRFVALERMLWCAVVAGGFQAELRQDEPKLAEQLEKAVLYWDKPFTIHECRIARGLTAIAAQNGLVAIANNA